MKKLLPLFILLFLISLTTYSQSTAKILFKKADSIVSDDSAKTLYKSAIKLASKEKNYTLRDSIYFALGKRFIRSGQLDSAREIANQAILSYQKGRENLIISSFYNMKAISFHHKGELDSALVYYLKAVTLLEDKKDSLKAATIRFNIGNIFLSYKDWTQANEHFEVMLNAIEKYKDSTYLGGVLSALSATQFELGNHQLATNYAQRAINISKQRNDISGEMLAYRQMGQITNNNEEIGTAIIYYNKALVLAKKIGMPYYLAMIKMNLCDAYKKAGRTEEAINAGLASLDYSEVPGFATQLPTVYGFLSAAYQKKGDYKNAYYFLNLSNDLKDKKVSEENKKIVNELLMKYNSEKKDKQITEQTLSLISKQKQTDIYFFIAIISLLIIVLLAGTLTFRYKLGKAKVKQLQQQKEQEVLLAIAEGEELEREKLSIAMHDGLSNTLFGCKLSLSSIQNQSTDISAQLQNNINLLNEAWKESRRISHNLMPIDLEQNNIIEAFESYTKRMNTATEKTNIQFQLFGQPKYELSNNQKILLFRAMQELTGNALKYANATEINIQLLYDKNRLEIVVDDNGSGIGSSEKEGKGLKNLYSRLKIINGSLTINTTEGLGTTATITIEYD